ncbi:MAG TPA: nuclear transport factor 2 family protein [Capillimicrobium sp.]|nr:nuclear transport factor 2 family protein [Capillimicrobium sp.]
MADRSIEARLQRLEDTEAIRRLFQAYQRALDSMDFRAYSRLFARDGVFVAGDMVATGPDEIFALVDAMPQSGLLTEKTGDDFHLVSNIDIEVDGDRARATSTWSYIVRAEDDTPRLEKLGHYEDELVREDGEWRFARRAAPTDIPRA